ncbi:hypothetical protein BDR26DRAFT_862083 [Obelidium mucronatum]|nr:hypothetical protein BDR26DRAFT_862083 [Obelidium mucronatum]
MGDHIFPNDEQQQSEAFDVNSIFDYFEHQASRNAPAPGFRTQRDSGRAKARSATPYERRISNPLVLPPPNTPFGVNSRNTTGTTTSPNIVSGGGDYFLPLLGGFTDEQNSDVYVNDDDDREARGRRVHREAEKQRRESLKIGFERMKELLPPAVVGTDKTWSQAKLLEAGLEYIEQLKEELVKRERENRKLKEAVRRIVVAHTESEG